MYYTGIDPFTRKPVRVAHGLADRKTRRALTQFFKPENHFEVRDPLVKAGRGDRIGGCDGPIPARPPEEADAAARADHYHSVGDPASRRAASTGSAGTSRAAGRSPRRVEGG